MAVNDLGAQKASSDGIDIDMPVYSGFNKAKAQC